MTTNWQWRLLRAGAFRLDGGSMFGVVPKALWSRMTEADDQNRIGLQTNCLLLHPVGSDTPRVLIETGYGNKWSDKERAIFALEQRTVREALREHNTDPADITHVIVSHLHFDHAGGLTHLNAAGEPTSSFPNAQIVVQQTEWDDALSNKSTMTKTYLRSHLDPIAGQVQTVTGEASPLDGITCWPVPGHTWGQHAIRFEDERGVVAFIGDAMPTVHHVGLAFSMAYDMLPYQSMLTKRDLLTAAAQEHWRLALDHEPGDAIVSVQRDEAAPDRFTLQAVSDQSAMV